jgi:hypothetical protein
MPDLIILAITAQPLTATQPTPKNQTRRIHKKEINLTQLAKAATRRKIPLAKTPIIQTHLSVDAKQMQPVSNHPKEHPLLKATLINQPQIQIVKISPGRSLRPARPTPNHRQTNPINPGQRQDDHGPLTDAPRTQTTP